MPKRTKHPRLRSHTWRTAGGEVRTAYYYDMRPDGQRDIPLGTDYQAALIRWHELYHDAPAAAGTLREAFDRWEAEVLPGYQQPRTRRDYALCLTQLRPVFQDARWADITLPVLKAYLTKRSAKTRANRELSILSIVWNWSRLEGLTELQWPAAGMQRSKWKNREKPREYEVQADVYTEIYAHGDQVLRDGMDIAAATGLRLTDVTAVQIPADGILRGEASKTGKRYAIDISESPTLSPLLARRRTYRVAHTRLLSTPTGIVSQRMLSDRFVRAREAAAADPEYAAISDQIRAMYLRDLRKLAATEASSLEAAQELLQHDSPRLTRVHYRQSVTPKKAVR
ncbi:MAG: hypothetical protein RIQ53_4186 [Pseudomonadota bacterium]|jgi:hypothetical protein